MSAPTFEEFMVKVNRSRIEAEEEDCTDDLSVASEEPSGGECGRAEKDEARRRRHPKKWSVLKMKLRRGRAKVGVADLDLGESNDSIHSFDDF